MRQLDGGETMFGHRDHQSSGRYSTAELIQIMERMPFFAALSAKERRGLARVGVERSYSAGEDLVRQGQELVAIGLYVILAGRVHVTQVEGDGRTRDLGELGPEQMFGEMALLDDQPRSATVTALEPTTALVISIYDFRAALSHNGEATTKLLAMLAERLRSAESTGQ
jgi:CRP/FNR family transcriptional regulator, cyclic AMP receptor protein